MSFIDAKSFPVAKQELNLFSIPPTQVAIVHTYPLTFFPKNPLNGNNPILFEIPGSPHFTDVSANRLYFKFRITRNDGTDMQCQGQNPRDWAAPINYILNTLWSQMKIYTGGRLLWDSADLYHYKSLVEAALGFSKLWKDSYLRTAYYLEDHPGQMNAVGNNNAGAMNRGRQVQNSRVAEVLGSLHADPFNQDKLWPPYLPFSIELFRNSNTFVVNTERNHQYKLEIIEICLQMQIVETVPSLTLAFEKQLAKTGAKYPIRRSEIKVLHVHAGRTDLPMTQIHTGQIPRRIIVFMVGANAFHGHYQQNPFNFQHFNLNLVQIMAAGNLYPPQPYEPDFEGANAMIPFHDMQKCMKTADGSPCSIQPAMYCNGYTFFCFDTSADQSASEGHFNVRQQGTVELRMRFGQPIDEPGIKVMVYMEFDSCLTLDHNRQFYLDYSI